MAIELFPLRLAFRGLSDEDGDEIEIDSPDVDEEEDGEEEDLDGSDDADTDDVAMEE